MTRPHERGARGPGHTGARRVRRALGRVLGAGAALALMAPVNPDTADSAESVAATTASEQAEHTRSVRRLKQDARRLEHAGRLESALRTAERAQALAPDDAQLLRLQARLLDALERPDDAQARRDRADRIDPPLPALPDVPLEPDGGTLLVVLLPPPESEQRRGRAPADWPGGEVHAVLMERLQTRLPAARSAPPPDLADATVPSLRAWLARAGRPVALSLRVDRAFCAETIKDGRFGLGALRLALEGRIHTTRFVHDESDVGGDCPARMVARALEQSLSWPVLAAALRRAGDDAALADSASLHALFPSLARRVDEALAEGRRWLSAGQLEDARTAFTRALAIDPDDVDARSFVAEVDRTLDIASQLSRRATDGATERATGPGHLDPELDATALRALEDELRTEQIRRDDLLAALSVMGGEIHPPSPEIVASLRAGSPPEADSTGASLARAALVARVEADEADVDARLHTRVVHTPEGDFLVRYYLAGDDDSPLLAEEDTRGDGRPDRYVAYANGTRSAVWEIDRGSGLPDLHLVYETDGQTLARVELGPARRPERIFVYRDGRVRSEFHDTTRDGRFDEVRHFDPDGALQQSERDLDHDGHIDVRSTYRDGKRVREEILNPDVVGARP